LDLADPASIDRAVEQVLGEAGQIDLLVNNAGYGEYGAIEDVSMALAARQMQVNLYGPARLCQLVLPGMRQRCAGRIINVSSMGGRFAMAFGGWDHASKHALEALSDALRQEVTRLGVDVVVVEPGAIRTEWGEVAAQTGAASSGTGAYASRSGRLTRLLRFQGVVWLLTSPDKVAAVIVRAASVSKPKPRYVVGLGARPVLLMRRLLPDRAIDWTMTRISG
jgi:NAD(P)-dependent dehydrogenase (short-subunit alcohol dehydrogenase family)